MFGGLCGIKRTWQIFKNEMLIYQSKAKFDEEISFGKITRYLDSEMTKKLVRGKCGNTHSSIHYGP